MAKKTWAYAKDNQTQEFVREESGRLRFYFIWQALRLRRKDPAVYGSITFYSTQQDESKRERMTTDKRGYFRYIEGVQGGTGGGDGESLSHSMAILALSQMKIIPFVINDNKYDFHFDELKIEDIGIKYENGNSYIPDLVGYFSKKNQDNPYYKKWSGRVAIEVKVSHACEDIKIHDFESHGLAILEISISDKIRIEPRLKNKTDEELENELERYFEYLKALFSDKVYATIKSDPVSVDYHQWLIKNAAVRCNALKEESDRLSHDFKRLTTRLEECEFARRHLYDEYRALEESQQAFMARPKWKKLFDVLMGKD